MTMRFIFAGFLIATGIYIIRTNSSTQLAIKRILFLSFIILGFVSIIFTEFWTAVSLKLGVESGTALLVYLVAFAFISNVISSYKWRKIQQDQIVHLARLMALNNVKELSKIE